MSSSTLLLGWWSRCNCCVPFSLVMGHSAAGSLRLSLSPSPSRTSWRLKDLCLLKSMLWLSVLDIVKCRSAVGLFCHHGYLIYKASTQPFPAFPVSTQHDPQCPWSQYSSFSGNPRCWVGFQVQYFWHCKIQSYIASHNNLFFLLRGLLQYCEPLYVFFHFPLDFVQWEAVLLIKARRETLKRKAHIVH